MSHTEHARASWILLLGNYDLETKKVLNTVRTLFTPSAFT